MYTNKVTPHGLAQPIELDVARRRARLEGLLDIRSRLSTLSVERRSHGLEDAMETFGQQMAVEAILDQEFPEVFLERLGAWVTAEAQLEHDNDRMHPECGICQAIAQRAGINVEPPEAA